MNYYTAVKIIQAFCFIGGPLVILFNFNGLYLFLAWLYSYIVVHMGISVFMHRGFAHRSWEPKNKLIAVIGHYLSVINLVNSTLSWVGTHRWHHKHSDTELDPHRIKDMSLWHRIKCWHNVFPHHRVPTRVIRDLLKDPLHRWFHKYYFYIIAAHAGVMLLIDIDLFLYGFIVSSMFMLHTTSWITVGAHIWGTPSDNTKDDSKNTWLMGLYMWGEGWHNNHHAKPNSYKMGWNKNQPDFGQYVIRLLAKPESLKYD